MEESSIQERAHLPQKLRRWVCTARLPSAPTPPKVGTSQRDNYRPLQKELPSRLEDLPPAGAARTSSTKPLTDCSARLPEAEPASRLASGRPRRGAERSIPGMETGSDSGQRPARPRSGGLRRSAAGLPEAARARRGGEERLGRAASAGRRVPGPRRERSRAGSRARGGRRQLGERGAEPQSRRAGRAYRASADGQRRLRRGAGLPERPSRELAGDGENYACSEEDAGGGGDGGRASWAQRGPRRTTGGGCRPVLHRERRAPSAARPCPPTPAPPSLPPRRNMAAAAASASQDELSKCHGQPAAASRSRRSAGPGAAAGAGREGRGTGPESRAGLAGGRRPRRAGGWGARAWRAGGAPTAAGVCRPQVCTVTLRN
ncbi:hypothetical protein J1605_019875 [Eschrichtius robustus]|uniref:Uncharacterized protein n=1 Tax=Eschrichtius robustus TaxID=9764 RepID=A0AB34HIK9_ESCRO|nr:hypothetical protein J1605_019875 [Eschrichtius robustus]